MADDENVKVFCRVRPPNERERGGAANVPPFFARSPSFVKKCVSVPTSDPLQQTVFLHLKHGQNAAQKTFTFDRVFGEDSSQNDVFEVVGVPITRACLEGYNGTIFAYGQTGSGKTFTMQGPDAALDIEAHNVSEGEKALRGLVPRVFKFLFRDQANKTTTTTHTFTCSFLEIYNERVYDLLDGNSARDMAGLQLRENGRKGVFVEGLTESEVSNAAKATELMKLGAQNRRVGQTAMNRESSRSHSVFILQIQSKETTPEGITKTRTSRFNLVDLAGSERQRSTEAAGDRLKEAGSINKSLSALGNVIMGLVEQSAGKNRHVHYRDSKLTFLLKDSLGGNSKTFMIATVSPAEDSSHETLSTLKFAQRAKLIRNNAVINEDASGNVLVLQEEIQRLRRQLQQARLEHPKQLKDDSSMVQSMPSSSIVLPVQCDPTVDERFRELEAAFATSIEKNAGLKRSFECLQLREKHLESLCTQMKNKLFHLRNLLRLQKESREQGFDEMIDREVEYEPSLDAVEWHLRYERLEQELELLKQQQALRSNGNDAAIAGEVQELDLLLLALAKQLACIVRDKHELQDRLNQFTGTQKLETTVSNTDNAELMRALDAVSTEYESRVNTLQTQLTVAEERAKALSLESLEGKEREKAMSIVLQDVQLKCADCNQQLRQSQQRNEQMESELLQEKKRSAQILSSCELKLEAIKAEYQVKRADEEAVNKTLVQENNHLAAELALITQSRDRIQELSKKLTSHMEAKMVELATVTAEHEALMDSHRRQLEDFAQLQNEAKTEQGRLAHEIAHQMESVQALTKEKQSVEEELTRVKHDFEDHQKQSELERTQFDDVKKELEQVASETQAKLVAAEKELEGVSSELIESRIECDAKASTIEDLKTENQSLKQSLTELNEKNQQLDSKLTTASSEVERLKLVEQELLAKLSAMAQELEYSVNVNKETANQLEKANDHIESLETVRQELDDQLAASSAINQELGGKLEVTEAQLAETQANEASLSQQLALNEEALSKKKDENGELTKTIASLTQTLDTVEASNRVLSGEKEQLLESSAELKKNVEALRTNLAESKAALSTSQTALQEAQETLERRTVEFECTLKQEQDVREKERAKFEENLTSTRQVHDQILAEMKESMTTQLENTTALLQEEKKAHEQHQQEFEAERSMMKANTEALCQALSAEKDKGIALQEAHTQQVKELTATHDQESARLQNLFALEKQRLQEVESTLGQQISKLQEQTVSLQSHVDQERHSVQRLQMNVQDLETTRQELLTQTQDLNATIEKAFEDLKNLKTDNQDLTSRLANATQESEAKEAELRQMSNDLAVSCRKNTELAAIVTSLEETLASMKASKESIEKEIESNKLSFEQQLAELQVTSDSQISAVKEQLAQSSVENQALTERIAAQQITLQQMGEQKQADDEKIDAMKDEIARLVHSIEQKESDVAKANKELAELSTALEAAVKEKRELMHEKDELASQYVVTKDKLALVLERADHLVHELESVNQKLQREELSHKEREAALHKTLTTLQDEYAVDRNEMTRRLDESTAAESKLRARVEELMDSKQQLEEALKQEIASCAKLDKAFAAALQEWEMREQQLVASYQESTSKHEAELTTMKQTAEKLSDERTQLESKLKDAEQMVADTTAELTEKSAAWESTQRRMNDAFENVSTQHKQEILQLQRLVEDGVKTAEQLKQQLEDAESMMADNEAKLQETVKDLEHQHDLMRKHQEANKQEIAHWTALEEKYKAEMTDLLAQLSNVEVALKDQAKITGKLQHSLECEREINRHLKETHAKEQEHHQEQIGKMIETIKELQDALEDKETKLASCAADLESRMNEIKTLNDEIATKESKIASITKELTTLQATYDDLKQSTDKIKQEMDQRQAELDQFSIELDAKATEMKQKESELSTDTKSLQQEKAELKTMKHKMKALKSSLEDRESRVEQLGLEKTQLVKEKNRLRREVANLNKQLEDVSTENDKLVSHHNMKQKIQHHIKVKEAHNKLVEQLKQMEQEMFKKDCTIERLKVASKGKENCVVCQQHAVNNSNIPSADGLQKHVTDATEANSSDGVASPVRQKKRLRVGGMKTTSL